HVTGFFEIRMDDNPLLAGSRGAGMCLSLGATSEVVLVPATKQSMKITINGKNSKADVTRRAIRHLIGDKGYRVEVTTELELPVSQGFGMSAAGSLSAAMAAALLLGKERQEAYEAAHKAEVESGCGLGDVAAIHRGGITLRRRAGLPPLGEVVRIQGEPEVVLAIIGRRLLTKEILKDEAKRREINDKGGYLVDSLVKQPSLEKLMTNSRIFALETGLATKRIARAIETASMYGQASMSMLGSSVFAVGDTQKLREALAGVGQVIVCKVDAVGPRIVYAVPDSSLIKGE
ncbi:MAG: pantoate kinase, partial [Thermoplasmata archaeon]